MTTGAARAGMAPLLRKRIPPAVRATLVATVSASLAGLLLPLAIRLPWPPTLSWLLDLAVHWQWLYALILACSCLAAAYWGRRWLLLLPACALPLLSASNALPPASKSPPSLRIVFANVHVSNRDPAALLAWLKREPVDVLAIAELSPPFAAALEREAPASLRHRTVHPLRTPWGLGLLSRHPLRDIRVVLAQDGIPRLEAWIDVEGRPVQIVVLHPKPPLSASMQHERDRTIRTVAQATHRHPRIVLGDLNASPWSLPLRDGERAGLMRATGLAPTWRATWRLRPGIPIDHVLASPDWSAGRSARGPDIGSDHRPVRAELHLRRVRPPAARPLDSTP